MTNVTLDAEVTNSSAASSSPSTVPNRTLIRSMFDPRNDTSNTPKPKDTRQNAAKLASSRCGVNRDTNPANIATKRPVTTPPNAIAPKCKPAVKKPTATPGKIACAMASPIRLMRRNTSNTPSGPAASANASEPASARRINPYSMNGKNSHSMTPIIDNHLHTNAAPNVDYRGSELVLPGPRPPPALPATRPQENAGVPPPNRATP